MFSYFSFIVNLFFNVVDHPVGRSTMLSDVAHSVPTNIISILKEIKNMFVNIISTQGYLTMSCHVMSITNICRRYILIVLLPIHNL